MKKLSTLILFLCLISQAFAQINKPATHALKGNGQVFFTETFGWENPADLKGWTAPAGFYMLDPNDNGFNWHWWGNDSLIAAALTKEPPMRSTTAENGSLCLFLSRYNEFNVVTRIDLDNSVVFPVIDCSSHGTVVVSYETCFMCYNANITWQMLMEVTVDNWLHAATYDVSFGVNHKGRPEKTTPGKPVIFQANISDVAAGQPNVQIKFTWRKTSLYFWQIDDFKLSEAWDNDLQMRYAQMEWTDGDDVSKRTPAFMMPKSQLAGNSFTNFKSAALNFGEYDQTDSYFGVDISKNNQNVFHAEGAKKNLYTLMTDTTLITDAYTPTEFGHYKVDYYYKSNETDNTPENNKKSAYFDVTDSVYSHADNSSEEAFVWGFESYGAVGYPNLNLKMGVQYKIYGDCEATSISAYIAGGRADGLIDYQYGLYYVPVGEEDNTPVELLVSEFVVYDSTMINKWITLPLTKDGESEFLKAGDLVYVCVGYNNQHTDLDSKRYENLKIGADQSFKILDPVSIAMDSAQNWVKDNSYINERILMIRLNINDHSNINDGVDLARTVASVGQNYPNPFNRTTSISYELNNESEVSISVMDLTGRMVMDIRKGLQPTGKHIIQLDASGLDAGIYLYTLKAGSFTETKRMTVAK
ncbi:MAG: T9SS type A sorting domain-containing protein [Bacteroidia bacterium]|nr:T9SS type A sorting domain-containing protein [Bacteroidia bacterium]